MTAEAAQLLRDGADLIELGGWCQGLQRGSHDRKGRRDVHGALFDAAKARDARAWRRNGMVLLAIEALALHLGGNVEQAAYVVTIWNDAESRTADEVVGAMRRAAILLSIETGQEWTR